jgi:Esterase/lipase
LLDLRNRHRPPCPPSHPFSRRRLLGAATTALGGLAALGGCVPIATANDLLVSDDGYTQWRGITYGDHPRQALDVYAPDAVGRTAANAKPARVVVFFYGGAWRSGTRDYYRFLGQALTDAGFVVVVPDYRLSPDVRFPVFNQDGAAAVRWVRDTITTYGGDPDDIVLMGHSAGAHIAALLVTDKTYLAAAGVPAAAIRGFVGLAGPYAIDPQQYRTSRPAFEGAEPPEVAIPTTHVDGHEPPMLLLHGADDRTVWPINSRTFADTVNAAGGRAAVIEYPDVAHIGILLGFSELFRSPDGAYSDAVRFIGASPASADASAMRASSAASSVSA